MTTEQALFGIYFVGLGGGAIAWGVCNLLRRRRLQRELAAEAGECVCSAHFQSCICEIGGVRNPRGVGRIARSVLYATPPDISRCGNLRRYGPTPCHYPVCNCFDGEVRT